MSESPFREPVTANITDNDLIVKSPLFVSFLIQITAFTNRAEYKMAGDALRGMKQFYSINPGYSNDAAFAEIVDHVEALITGDIDELIFTTPPRLIDQPLAKQFISYAGKTVSKDRVENFYKTYAAFIGLDNPDRVFNAEEVRQLHEVAEAMQQAYLANHPN